MLPLALDTVVACCASRDAKTEQFPLALACVVAKLLDVPCRDDVPAEPAELEYMLFATALVGEKPDAVPLAGVIEELLPFKAVVPAEPPDAVASVLLAFAALPIPDDVPDALKIEAVDPATDPAPDVDPADDATVFVEPVFVPNPSGESPSGERPIAIRPPASRCYSRMMLHL